METRWLKSVFQETEYESDSPQPKRVKFADLSAELQAQFPDKKYTPLTVSKLIEEAFPHSERKACGKSRQKHVLGIQRKPLELAEPGPSCGPSTSSSLEPSYSDLLIENQKLKERIQELERTSAASLCQQADSVIQHKSAVTDGPSSLDAFNYFNFSSIITELQLHAPDLYRLFMMIGDTTRNQVTDEITSEQTKAVSALCSLLSARSMRMKGLQLLVSMMLIARATSKQVWAS